jgi:hypothetical protein
MPQSQQCDQDVRSRRICRSRRDIRPRKCEHDTTHDPLVRSKLDSFLIHLRQALSDIERPDGQGA